MRRCGVLLALHAVKRSCRLLFIIVVVVTCACRAVSTTVMGAVDKELFIKAFADTQDVKVSCFVFVSISVLPSYLLSCKPFPKRQIDQFFKSGKCAPHMRVAGFI